MKQVFTVFTFLSTFLTILGGCRNSTSSQIQIRHSLDGNIVGGESLEEATDARSSTVLLLFVGGGAGAGVCTGTLIASDIVLTAAHCTPDKVRGRVVVGFGNNIEGSFGSGAKYSPAVVIDYRIDPLYDANDLGKNSVHDIALLKFSGGIPESFKVRELPAKNFAISSFDELEMIGFGRTSEEQSDAGTLHYTRVPSSQITAMVYDSDTGMDYALPGNIAIQQPATGVCNGDSGGPLFAKSADGKITLIGVTSRGGNLQNESLSCHGYALFVDVRSQIDWIKIALADLRKETTTN